MILWFHRAFPTHSFLAPAINLIHFSLSAASVMIPASILQEPLSDIHQLVLSPNISVSSIYALGSGRTFFNINSSNFMIFNTAMVPPGSYSLDIVIHDGNTNSLVYVFVTINVMPEGELSMCIELKREMSNVFFCSRSSLWPATIWKVQSVLHIRCIHLWLLVQLCRGLHSSAGQCHLSYIRYVSIVP